MNSPGANHVSPLLINTMNQRLNIKSEPISPTRDSNTPSNTMAGLRPPSQTPGHLSPGHMSPHLNTSHSNCSSPTANMQQHGGGVAPPPHQNTAPPGNVVQNQQQQQHGLNGGGGGMTDFDNGPLMKRQRVEGWTT